MVEEPDVFLLLRFEFHHAGADGLGIVHIHAHLAGGLGALHRAFHRENLVVEFADAFAAGFHQRHGGIQIVVRVAEEVALLGSRLLGAAVHGDEAREFRGGKLFGKLHPHALHFCIAGGGEGYGCGFGFGELAR